MQRLAGRKGARLLSAARWAQAKCHGGLSGQDVSFGRDYLEDVLHVVVYQAWSIPGPALFDEVCDGAVC